MNEIDELKQQLSEIYSRIAELEHDEGRREYVLRQSAKQFIINEVCYHFKVSRHDLRSRKRFANITMTRQVICWVMKTCGLYYTLSEIGAEMKRDHATVIHSVKVIENYLETDKQKREEFLYLREKITKLLNL
jgi:chromosomal replication initiation ATPase DnaA